MMVLVIASILFGDILFITVSIARTDNVPESFELFTRVAGNIVSLELGEGSGGASLIFALIGAIYAVYQKGRKPKFAARFEPLPPA